MQLESFIQGFGAWDLAPAARSLKARACGLESEASEVQSLMTGCWSQGAMQNFWSKPSALVPDPLSRQQPFTFCNWNAFYLIIFNLGC